MLEREKSYCYFRRQISEEDVDQKAPLGPRDRPETNAASFRKLKESLTALQFEESEQDLIWKILAAIILLGEIEYKEDEDGNADIKDVDVVDKGITICIKTLFILRIERNVQNIFQLVLF